MSWVSDYKYCWYETLAMNVVKVGPVPRHIAFIMDGNRRFAKSANIDKIEGHAKGFDKLAECLRWCLDMGIQEVTTFAFSIENFKRTDDEVNALMNLARDKFEQLLHESDKLKENGVRIRIIGNLSLLSEELQAVISRAMLETESNNKLFLNIAFAYTSRDEMTNSIQSVLELGDELQADDINERLLEQCMYTKDSPEPDLLFRTSGESRISDFLMWQLSCTILYFTTILWPQLTIWHFMCGIFAYQRASLNLNSFRSQRHLEREQLVKSANYFGDRVQNFLRRVDSYRRNVLLSLSSSHSRPKHKSD